VGCRERVATTPLTRGRQVDVEADPALERHGALVGARAADQAEARHERLRDTATGHGHGLSQLVLAFVAMNNVFGNFRPRPLGRTTRLTLVH
jgi:hypothetical protein